MKPKDKILETLRSGVPIKVSWLLRHRLAEDVEALSELLLCKHVVFSPTLAKNDVVEPYVQLSYAGFQATMGVPNEY